MPPTAYGLRGFALRLPPPPPFRGGRVALCRQGCRAYGPAALLSFTPAGSVGRSRSVKGRCAFRGWPVSSLRCGPRQPPPPPLTALPLQQPDSQTAANRSKRPVAAFFGLGGTSGRGGARKRAVGPFPGFLAVSADSTLNGHLFQYFVDSSPLHLDTWLLRLPATTCRWLLHLDCSRSTELNGRYPATKSTAEISVPGHQRTVAVTFELVALSDAERPVFGEQFEGGNFENRPEAEIRADLEIRGHQSDF